MSQFVSNLELSTEQRSRTLWVILTVMKAVLVTLVFLLMCEVVYGETVVFFESYTYKDTHYVVRHQQVDTFVLCDNCQLRALSPFVLTESKVLEFTPPPKAIVSVKYVEPSQKAPDFEEPKRGVCESQYVVYFEFGKHTLTRDQTERLKTVASKLKGMQVDVFGYACSIGSEGYNRALSTRRAQTVAEFLRKEGVILKTVAGLGELDESDIKALNRKVEVKIKKKGGD